MLNLGRLGGLVPGARRVMIFGDTDIAGEVARGAARAGCRVSRHDISYLQSGVVSGTLILDAGSETATLAEARRTASRLESGTIAVVMESWNGFTAALALDAELGTGGVRVRPLCAAEDAARSVMRRHPWWRLNDGGAGTAVILGTCSFGEHLVVALFRAMHLPGRMPQVVVVAPDAPGWVAGLRQRLPPLDEIGSVIGAVRATEVSEACVIYATAPSAEITSFSAAVPLVWLAGGEAPAHARRGARPDWTSAAQSFFDPKNDSRAKAIHDFYYEAALRDGNAPGSRPSMMAWAALPERFRQASRYQGDHVAAKLAAIGARAVAGRQDWRFRFSAGEVEALARAEHERWSAVQRLDGWRFGEKRDDAARLTPFLAPYDSLPPEIQDRDRMPVRQIPAQLARIGQAVRRDLKVSLSANAEAVPGIAFGYQFRALLAQIAAHYPDRHLVLCTSLRSALERRAVVIALKKKLASLCVALPPDLAAPAEAEHLLAQAETLMASPLGAEAALHIHLGDDVPAGTRRLVAMTPGGSLRVAPWL
ncbi:MAG: hypothetical protein JO256_07060 [Alphaproteobacteria bacterium]|nr:hypothetical protein [Alphaproteobacteria bacterium]